MVLAIQLLDRDNPSLHPIKGGDAEGLKAKLDAARQRLVKASGQVPKLTLWYEAGYDGFWLVRGVDRRVMDPASLQVDRRARRVKTDRIDVEKNKALVGPHKRAGRNMKSKQIINDTTFRKILRFLH